VTDFRCWSEPPLTDQRGITLRPCLIESGIDRSGPTFSKWVAIQEGLRIAFSANSPLGGGKDGFVPGMNRCVRSVVLPLHFARGAAAVVGTMMVFEGFRQMPLAEC
jgi:hypothetical protein